MESENMTAEPENTNIADANDIETTEYDTHQEQGYDASVSDSESETTVDDTPDWFMKDKYKSIEEQARSAYELQKKMGKFWGAPKDDYKIENIEGIDSDDPLVKNLVPALKDMGISQDGFNHLVNEYMNANKTMMKELEESLKKELTQNDAHTYREIEKWMGEVLRPEEARQIKNNWLMSAEDFKLFNTLRLMAAPNTSVPNSNQSTVRFESSTEVENDKIKYRKEVKDGLRVADKNYENELAARFRDARARELRSQGR